MNIEDSDNNNREDERSDDNQKKEETLLRSSENSLKQRSSVGSHRSSTLEYPDDPEDAKDRKSVLYNVAGYIIVTEFCERLAYYTFATSLVLFFQTELNYSNAEADVQYSAWAGFCYVTPLLGGYIADTYLGRYKTILVFCLIYLLGLILVVVACDPKNISAALFFPAIYIIATGTGGIKPNVSTMGADQFDDKYSNDRKEKESFFNWFYWSINLGALIANLFGAYICQYGIKGLGGAEYSFFVGYTIPVIFMAVAIVIFVMGTHLYTIATPNGSILGRAMRIVYEAVWTKRGVVTGTGQVLDRAKTPFGGSFTKSQVEGVKLVTRLTPFLFVMIPYWGIYSQMSTAFQNQGCQMDLTAGGSLNVPVSALNAFDTVAILILVPVFDGYIYPYFVKIGRPLTMLQKIGLGFGFALIAMLVAALIEVWRLKTAPSEGDYYDVSARDNITPCQSIDDYDPYKYQAWYDGDPDTDEPANCHSTCDDVDKEGTLILPCISCDNIPQMSSLSVFWQVPQFVLIGVSEVLASITSLEFFYTQAPLAMRSVTQSLNLFTQAIGAWIVIPILLLVNVNKSNQWVPADLDTGHLDYYFLLLASMMAVTIGVFNYIAQGYEYKTSAQLVIEDTPRGSFSTNDVDGENDGAVSSLIADTDSQYAAESSDIIVNVGGERASRIASDRQGADEEPTVSPLYDS